KASEGMEFLKKSIVRNNLVYGPIVAKDFSATQIILDYNPEVPSREIFKALNDIVAKEKDDQTNFYLAGRPILEGWLDYYLPKLLSVFLGTLMIMAILLFLAFRSKRGIILPFLGALMGVTWGLGVLTLSGYHLDPTTTLVPFLILAIGISHSIQFIKRYYEEIRVNPTDREKAAEQTLAALSNPVRASLFTDGLGFLSLLIVPLTMIKTLAIAAGAGVFSLYLTVVTFIPAILAYIPVPVKLEAEREARTNVVDKLLNRIAWMGKHPLWRTVILLLFIGLTALGIKGITQIVVGDNEEGSAILYPHSPYNVAEKLINEKFTGANPYYIFVEGKEEEALVDSTILKEMDSLQSFLRSQIPEIGNAVSLADYIKGLNCVMNENNPAHFIIPDNNGTIAEYLYLYSTSGFPGDFDPVLSPDYKYANIKFDLKDHRGETIKKTIAATQSWIQREHKSPVADLKLAGGLIGTTAAVNDIIEQSVTQNIILVFLLVLLRISVALRSLTGGVFLFIPLTFSIILTFGIFGLSGVSLTVETLPVAAMGIGLGIDYSIYIAARIREESLRGLGNPDVFRAIQRALVTSGKAVFFTGMVISTGVLSWLFSSIKLQAKLGAALGSLLLINMMAALILLPIFIGLLKPKFIFRKDT
ncbi:MAG: MMPL family transporter, partial [Pseudomonadota bacterium]